MREDVKKVLGIRETIAERMLAEADLEGRPRPENVIVLETARVRLRNRKAMRELLNDLQKRWISS